MPGKSPCPTCRRFPAARFSRGEARRDTVYAMNTTTILFRPVGQREWELVAESGFRAFPPRLLEQPIFYPVLNEQYAAQIARDWNTKDATSSYIGYVLRFAVDAAFLSRYEVQTVGVGGLHEEYWIPADDLPAFNVAIVGTIETVQTFRPA